MQPTHTFVQPVTFGDCDPAGIVFYPNVFRWLDAAFHDWLRPAGGHGAICERLGAVGLGLIDVGAQFRSPIRDGDRVRLHMQVEAWGRRSFSLLYEGETDGKPAFTAREVRGLFAQGEGGLVAAELARFRGVVERHEYG